MYKGLKTSYTTLSVYLLKIPDTLEEGGRGGGERKGKREREGERGRMEGEGRGKRERGKEWVKMEERQREEEEKGGEKEREEVRGNNIDSIHHSEDVDIHTVY